MVGSEVPSLRLRVTRADCHLAAAGHPLDLVLAAGQVLGLGGVGQQRHDERLLEPALAVGPLEQGEVGAAVVEVERRPQPEDLHLRRLEVGGRLLAHAPHAPRAVTGGAGALGVDLEGDAGGQRDGALPRAPLGEAGVVHHRHVVAHDLLPGLLDGLGAGPEGDVGGEAVVVLAHHVAHGPQRLDDLDAQRPDLGGPGGGHGARREHRVLDAVVHDRERGVDHAPVRVVAHGAAEEELALDVVAVEPVAVVVVGIGRDRLGDGRRGLVDRVVVERRQHLP